MTKKEELLKLVEEYESDFNDFHKVKRRQFWRIFSRFFGDYVINIGYDEQRQGLTDKKNEIINLLNSISSDIAIEDYLAIRKRVMMVGSGRQ